MTFDGLLPIGSVVLLKGSSKRLMITGVGQYALAEEGARRLYDYVAVVFPEGYLNPEENYLFDNEQIDKVYFIGLQHSESIAFLERADQTIARLRAEG